MEHQLVKKPRILCFHGHRSSGAILKKQIEVWPEFVLDKMDLVFVNAPFPVEVNTGDKGKHDPHFFEWFQSNEDFTEYWNFDEFIAYIEDCMEKLGPFDGLLGFSQGALLWAALQSEGVTPTKVEKIKFVIIISGGKFGGSKFSAPKLAENAFAVPIACPSVHIFGEKDIAKSSAIELLDSYVKPFVIYHHEGHCVPHLDEEGLKVMFRFVEKIQSLL